MKLKNRICTILFVAGGALAGLGYYFWAGCGTGGCAISSSPIRSMVYMALVGALLSRVLWKEDKHCSM